MLIQRVMKTFIQIRRERFHYKGERLNKWKYISSFYHVYVALSPMSITTVIYRNKRKYCIAVKDDIRPKSLYVFVIFSNKNNALPNQNETDVGNKYRNKGPGTHF